MRKDEQQPPRREELADLPAAPEGAEHGDEVKGGGRPEYTWKIEDGIKRQQPGLTSP